MWKHSPVNAFSHNLTGCEAAWAVDCSLLKTSKIPLEVRRFLSALDRHNLIRYSERGGLFLQIYVTCPYRPNINPSREFQSEQSQQTGSGVIMRLNGP